MRRSLLLFLALVSLARAGSFPYCLSSVSNSLGISSVLTPLNQGQTSSSPASVTYGDCVVSRSVLSTVYDLTLSTRFQYQYDMGVSLSLATPANATLAGFVGTSQLPASYSWAINGSAGATWSNTSNVSVTGASGATYTAPVVWTVSRADVFTSLTTSATSLAVATNAAMVAMTNLKTPSVVWPLFTAMPPPPYTSLAWTRNAANMLTVGGYDVTGHSVAYQSQTDYYQGTYIHGNQCTAITPRHAIYASHIGTYLPGNFVYFVDAANTTVTMTVASAAQITDPTTGAYTDLSIVTFTSDLPAGIAKYKFPPADWLHYLPSIAFDSFPTVLLSNNTPSSYVFGAPIGFGVLSALGSYSVSCGNAANSPQRTAFAAFIPPWPTIIGGIPTGIWGIAGDSSSIMLILNPSAHELCVLGCVAEPTPSGTYAIAYIPQINAIMAADYAAARTPVLYTCQFSDFSAYNYYTSVGANATLSATVAGSPPFTYQWSKGGVTISGATAATLTLTNVQLTDAGTYVCTITNSGGSTTPSVILVVQ